MPRTQAPLDAPSATFWHQKWPCVLGIGANDEDRGRLLVLKWRLGGSPWGSAWGQILSACGPDGVGGKLGGKGGRRLKHEEGEGTVKTV